RANTSVGLSPSCSSPCGEWPRFVLECELLFLSESPSPRRELLIVSAKMSSQSKLSINRAGAAGSVGYSSLRASPAGETTTKCGAMSALFNQKALESIRVSVASRREMQMPKRVVVRRKVWKDGGRIRPALAALSS